jgi:hypothetical protein
VVGALELRRGADAFLYRAGHLIRLRSPRGFQYSAALSINENDVIVATAGNGIGWNGQAYFVGRLHRSHIRWSRLSSVGLGQVATNGDVVGNVNTGSGEQAAVWEPATAGTYRVPARLPLSGSFSRSSASVIWSGEGRVVVAGQQWFADKHAAPVVTLWSRTKTSQFKVFVDGTDHYVSTLGGSYTHLYVGGSVSGYDTSSAWAGAVTFEHGWYAAIRSEWGLAAGTYGGLFVDTNGVTSGSKNRLLAVGRAVNGNTRRGVAMLWRGHGMGVPLQTLLGAGTPWKLHNAIGVTAKGEVFGIGQLNGVFQAYILSIH